MIKDLPFRKRRITKRFSAAVGSERSLYLASTFSKRARAAIAEANRIEIENISIYLKKLPKSIDGFRIIHLSDIHHSPLTNLEHIRNAVKIANSLKPDMFVLTGDYVSHEREYIEPVARVLGELSSKLGTFACLGNHDHWTDAELVTQAFRNAKIEVLINEGFRVKSGGESFWLSGVDDYMMGKTDIDSALKGSLANEMKILLAHNPAVFSRAVFADIDLVLSGHTHGGQIKLGKPRGRFFFPNRQRKLKNGLHQRKNSQIYITRGIGTVVLPMRYQCPPEISVLELRATTF
jgi:uncharacterized protein